MEYNYLQGFLDARLFILGEDNSQYQNIVATVPLVKKAILKEMSSFVNYVLLALDSTDEIQDPLLDNVEDILKKKWPTVRNKFSDQPVTLLRAIIIEALTQLAKENNEKAALLYLSGTSYFSYLKRGQENEILSRWLSEMGSLMENLAVKGLSIELNSLDFKIPQLDLPVFKAEKSSISSGDLKAGLLGAVTNGNNITNGGYGSPVTDAWAQKFSEKASNTITTAVQAAFEGQNQALRNFNLNTPLINFFSELKKSFKESITSTYQNIHRLDLRTTLLWWKEALYSSSQKKSYRELNAETGIIVMALDVAQLVPSIYPTSVDYFLRESARNVYGDLEKPISEWAASIADSGAKQMLQSLQLDGYSNGRISLLAFIHLMAVQNENVENIYRRTGINPSVQIPLVDFIVYLFHELQALKLVK